MQVLSQSAFLQALGYAIAGSLWQTALLWLVAAGINGLFKLSAQVKYKVALTAQFGAFVWFLVSLQFYYSKCGEAIALLKYSGLNTGNAFVLQPGHSFSATLLSAIMKGEKLLPYLSVAYLCLLVVLAVRWINGYRQTNIIKTQGLQKIDVEWKLFVKKIAALLNIKHEVGIYVSELVKSPLTVGFLKPLILIPIASINNLTTYQLEAVILHELAHIKRADYIINIVQSIIETALFFNPFIQLLGKITKRERENSCDDWVLQFQYDASTYAEALLRIAYMQQAPAFAMNAAGKENDLLWRVKRMLNQQQKSFQYRNRLLALLLITGMLSSVAWFTPGVKAGTAAKAGSPVQPVVAEPLAMKVDNPLFNPVSFLNKTFKAEVSKTEKDATAGIEEATKKITGEALNNVAASLDNIKIPAISVDLPSTINNAAGAVNTALANFSGSDEAPANLKVLSDSGFVKNAIVSAASQLKNIPWGEVNKGLDEAKREILKAKGGDAVTTMLSLKGLDIAKLTMNALSNVKVSNRVNSSKDETGENNGGDDDNNSVIISAPGGVTLKNSIQAGKAQLQLQQRRNELKRKADSLAKIVYNVKGYRKRQQNDLGDLSNDVAVQYFNNAQKTYNYNTQADYKVTQVRFTQPATTATGTVPVTAWSQPDGNISVSSTNGSTLIAVKEEKDDVNSYKKRLTIETMDPQGQKHTFHITVEVYQ